MIEISILQDGSVLNATIINTIIDKINNLTQEVEELKLKSQPSTFTVGKTPSSSGIFSVENGDGSIVNTLFEIQNDNTIINNRVQIKDADNTIELLVYLKDLRNDIDQLKKVLNGYEIKDNNGNNIIEKGNGLVKRFNTLEQILISKLQLKNKENEIYSSLGIVGSGDNKKIETCETLGDTYTKETIMATKDKLDTLQGDWDCIKDSLIKIEETGGTRNRTNLVQSRFSKYDDIFEDKLDAEGKIEKIGAFKQIEGLYSAESSYKIFNQLANTKGRADDLVKEMLDKEAEIKKLQSQMDELNKTQNLVTTNGFTNKITEIESNLTSSLDNKKTELEELYEEQMDRFSDHMEQQLALYEQLNTKIEDLKAQLEGGNN